MTLVDTNVISEALRPAPAAAVEKWFLAQPPASLHTTAVSAAEILAGLEALPVSKRRQALMDFASAMFSVAFRGRVLPFTYAASQVYARLLAHRKSIGRPISQPDAMIAAIALVNEMTLATRNIKDFEHCGLTLVNPWHGPA